MVSDYLIFILIITCLLVFKKSLKNKKQKNLNSMHRINFTLMNKPILVQIKNFTREKEDLRRKKKKYLIQN